MTLKHKAHQQPSSLLILLTTISLTVSIAESGFAQILPDQTLGAEGSVLIRDELIRGLPADVIQGGANRGVNLFHSFLEFNVQDGQRVYFANPIQIENIIGRVTGSNGSDILGTLGVLGNANLFLVNPNGIVFGPNAQLDIRGSFLATTADGFKFPDGSEFSATNPQAPPLLTINVPIGLQYGSQSQRATITNYGILQVGQNFTLSGGNLELQGQLYAGQNLTLQAQDRLRMRDSATDPLIASAGGELLAQGNGNIEILALNHPNSGLFSGQDMVLRSGNRIEGNAHYWSGGNFQIEKLDGSVGNLFSPADPIVVAVGDVKIGDYSGASLHILAGGSVELGYASIDSPDETDTTINPDNQNLIPGTNTPYSALSSVILSDGKTGLSIKGNEQATLDVRAGIDWNQAPFTGPPTGPDAIVIPDGSVVPEPPSEPPTLTGASINIGYIEISQPGGLVYLTNQYHPNTLSSSDITVGDINTGASGDAGDVFIDSRSGINLNGTIEASGGLLGGNGGDVTLLANGDITLGDGVSIRSDTNPLIPIIGLGGNITLNSHQSDILVSGGRISTSTNSITSGTGGDINIIARSFVGKDRTELSTASSLGEANAGNIIIKTSNSVTLDGQSRVTSQTRTPGNGGDIRITTGSLTLLDNSSLRSRTSGKGNAGNVMIQADSVTFEDSVAESAVESNAEAEGKGGDIRISTGSLLITSAITNSGLSTRTEGKGDSGNILIQARDRILLNNDQVRLNSTTSGAGNAGNIIISAPNADLTFDGAIKVFTSVQPGAVSDGGNIDITGRSLSLNNGVAMSATTAGVGNAGRINLNIGDGISVANSQILTRVDAKAVGNGGEIGITGRSLSLTNNSQVSASTAGFGNAGKVDINVGEQISVANSQISSSVESGAIGVGGDIQITGRDLSLTNNSQVSASTAAQGSAGKVNLNIAEGISVANSQILSSVQAGAVGNGGEIGITGGSLSLTDNAQVNASTSGRGDAGKVNINIDDQISLGNSQILSRVEAEGVGNGGEINIAGRELFLRDNSRISASSAGVGNAGKVNLNIAEGISVANSRIASLVQAGARGNGGDVEIAGRSLSLINNSQINARTSGVGDAGRVNLKIGDQIGVTNSQILSSVAAGAVGKGGEIGIRGRELFLNNNSQVNANTAGVGNAGSINIDVNRARIENGSEISAATAVTADGDGGSIQVRANTLQVSNGGKLRTITAGSGDAGNIGVLVQDQVNLSGADTGLFANTEAGSTGKGGSIFVDPISVNIENGAGIAVGSQGSGEGGNISIQAGALRLANQAFISAETASNQGGDINLDIGNILLMRDGSKISTTAGMAQGGGDGGNITINAPFIIGISEENSDITANAFEGRGGNIQITTQGIFGLEYRASLTPLSDITASSQFGVDGVVSINGPDIDPSRGLVALPTSLVDASRLIAQSCAAGGGAIANRIGSFTISGRGGLPPNPNESLNSDAVWQDWRLINNQIGNSVNREVPAENSQINLTAPRIRQIVEAQGWVKTPDGRVILVAQSPTVTPYGSGLSPVICPAP